MLQDGLLSGLKVLDLSHYVSGPYCTRLLAGLGAQVVKVERPQVGDGARRVGPFPGDIPHRETSALFLYLNSSKLGITLDLKSRTGGKILRELLREADVLVENFQPRVMPSLGLDYETLKEINPGLIMTSISNFGQWGPYKDYSAQELNLYAIGGLMHITGEPDREPLQVGARLAQYGAGQSAFVGTLTALWHREMSEEGQQVDVSIAEYCATILENALSTYSYTGNSVRRSGNRGYGRAAWGIYPCKDGYVGVIAGPDYRWPAVAELMEEPALSDPRFETRRGRELCADEIEALMQPWLDAHEKLEIFEKGQQLGLAFAYVATPEDIFHWPHLREREYFVAIDHPKAGTLEYPGPPYRPEGFSWQFRPAPTLGQHNQEVYCGRLGYSRRDLAKLAAAGVI